MKGDSRPGRDGGPDRVHIDDEPTRTWEGGANPPRSPGADAARALLAAVDDPPTGEDVTVLRVALGDGAPATLERVTTRVDDEPAIHATSIGTDAGPARSEAFDALMSPRYNPTVTAAGLWTSEGVAGVAFATYRRQDSSTATGSAGEDTAGTFEQLQAEHSTVPYDELVAELDAAGLNRFEDGADVDALVDADEDATVTAAADAEALAPVYGDGGTLADTATAEGAAGGPDERAPALEPPEGWFEDVASDVTGTTTDPAEDGDDEPAVELEFPDEEEAAACAEADTVPVGADVDAGDDPDDEADAGPVDGRPGAPSGRDGSPADGAFGRLLDAIEAAGLPESRDGCPGEAVYQPTTGEDPASGSDRPAPGAWPAEAAPELAAIEERTDDPDDDVAAAIEALRDRQALLARATACLLETVAVPDSEAD
jgi:hypothetical protein